MGYNNGDELENFTEFILTAVKVVLAIIKTLIGHVTRWQKVYA